eukprot:scaffold764_cov408-Prasinococcus_capsulatus_cf.AAC.3
MDLLIKVYPEGNMSKHIGEMKIGDRLEMKGPIPKIEYKPNQWKHVSMVAGGTGITPMLQVIQEIDRNPADKTKVTLLFANVRQEDILCRSEIDRICARNPDQCARKAPADACESRPTPGMYLYCGLQAMLESQLPKDTDMVFVCGPPPMMRSVSGDKAKGTAVACCFGQVCRLLTESDGGADKTQGELQGFLKAMGRTEANVFKF